MVHMINICLIYGSYMANIWLIDGSYMANNGWYPLVIKLAGWKIPYRTGGFLGKITDFDGQLSSTPCLSKPEGKRCQRSLLFLLAAQEWFDTVSNCVTLPGNGTCQGCFRAVFALGVPTNGGIPVKKGHFTWKYGDSPVVLGLLYPSFSQTHMNHMSTLIPFQTRLGHDE